MPMPSDSANDIASIQAISAVPVILETVAAITGLRFVCIARVTEDSWTTCAVFDQLDFGLKVGDGLEVATTLCEEVRNKQSMVVIDCVAEDPVYRDHRTPRMYGFQSYISVPVFRQNGAYFGTLCGLDPQPAALSAKSVTSSLTLFAKLISLQLETESRLAESQHALLDEREGAELREQFIAILGHDLRTPLGSILLGADLLLAQPLDQKSSSIVQRVRRSAIRISMLVNDVVDFTRGRLGKGIPIERRPENWLQVPLQQVIAELRSAYPERTIQVDIAEDLCVDCDPARVAQMLSNLLKNALVHGDPQLPVTVVAKTHNGIFEVAVTNGGPAIPTSTIGQLFKPFWRAPNQGVHDGLGLGLFIVSEIARSHGGTVDVASTDDATSFIFRLHGADFVERRLTARI